MNARFGSRLWQRYVWATGGFSIVCSLMVLGFKPLASKMLSRSAGSELAQSSVIVHLFEWTWDDIAQECEAFLGPQGYHAVQISPPQEHIVAAEQGFPWWQRYQPVSYQLVSRSGDRAQLRNMVQRCRTAGVEIYADAVINHMAALDNTIGSAGTKFSRYDYPGLYQSEDFNPCRRPITNYQDAEQVTQCELVSLPDLNTASPHVQSQLADYLVDLVSLGIAGFRIDAAKHIRSDDLAVILQQTRDRTELDPFIYQEVIDPGTEAIKKQSYYALGDVVEFEYGRLVGEAFLNVGNLTLADLQTFEQNAELVPSHQAVVFIDNHDKQRGHGGGGTYLTYHDGQLHTLSMVFMLAYPYGKPRIMSSYAFETSEQGPPTMADGRTRRVYEPDGLGCGDAWICEHRQPAVTAMVAFRAATQAVPEVTDWWSNGRNQIAFGRGERGFIVINREETALVHTFQTQLPAGDYCDIIQSASQSTLCDRVITVNAEGQFRVLVEPMSAIALHQDSQP
ncbi:alpha-amylase family protein [Oscillatoria sp. CS-180]|uniref:alpha-amylase n=1 Tax=Oscillatoria sp. CS-180 TaxID=3021720 RepID=UPI00232B0E3E|nr:alpha-amylase family protein [Oscillatoria sp. CS-180]MDB9525033.1 alpha-amylase family protein [Oscillatoria sp. CS-180]